MFFEWALNKSLVLCRITPQKFINFLKVYKGVLKMMRNPIKRHDLKVVGKWNTFCKQFNYGKSFLCHLLIYRILAGIKKRFLQRSKSFTINKEK